MFLRSFILYSLIPEEHFILCQDNAYVGKIVLCSPNIVHFVTLPQAALFGKSFIPEMNPEPCKKTIFTLRVLNAVRDYRVGLPLTWSQMEHLTLPVLLDRLVHRRFFPLALEIANFLKIPETDGTSRILAHWACFKVGEQKQFESRV
ncbi:Vacuolar protein sorting-associated protein 16 [Portunus trituberculatus]|uniref:Vacuolar protein sorting-associated protein 16 n=1 Tax=Portunus trituberculatus TaxID=210409 RepID=A0A5B7I8F9_PORTR|nr:Vacuolar protein sorting-associated protein 16 [Portunus trituberculatus]